MYSIDHDDKAPSLPWFGIDIGGSLTKIAYFHPNNSPTNQKLVPGAFTMLSETRAIPDLVVDEFLTMKHCRIGGRRGSLHFLRFPSERVAEAIQVAKEYDLHEMTSIICATGGGAEKFEDLIRSELKVNFHKCDELASLVRGIHYVERFNKDECYYYESNVSGKPTSPESFDKKYFDLSSPYPYLVVNVGSGVSMVAVRSLNNFRRVNGTSIGGGTFLGLTTLLTGCGTFEDAVALATKGDSDNVDKLVRDIYGGDYSRFDLAGHVVASSFGKITSNKNSNMTREDLARGALTMVTNNVTGIAKTSAAEQKINRVVFVGNFLRKNLIAQLLISQAMQFWSKNTIQALFLQHEGYFGAAGCLTEHLVSRSELAHRSASSQFGRSC